MIHWDKLTPEQTKRMDRYLSLRLSEHDMEQCCHSINMATALNDNRLIYPLMRDAVVSYCKPFSGNKGRGGVKRSLSMKEWVLKEHWELHRQLIEVRNLSFAHSDLEAKNPNLAMSNNGVKVHVMMSFVGVQFEEFSKQKALIYSMAKGLQNRLWAELEKYHAEFWNELTSDGQKIITEDIFMQVGPGKASTIDTGWRPEKGAV
jgi:hypothetical protein